MTSGGGAVAWRLALSFDEHEVESMPLTPEDVSNKRFTTVRLREGYDMTEVDQFLDEIEAELRRLHGENGELQAKLRAAGLEPEIAAPGAGAPAADAADEGTSATSSDATPT